MPTIEYVSKQQFGFCGCNSTGGCSPCDPTCRPDDDEPSVCSPDAERDGRASEDVCRSYNE